MASLSVTDVIKESDIYKSYLYKLIDKENILIPRSDTGRYFWDENTVEIIKRFLHIDGLQYKNVVSDFRYRKIIPYTRD